MTSNRDDNFTHENLITLENYETFQAQYRIERAAYWARVADLAIYVMLLASAFGIMYLSHVGTLPITGAVCLIAMLGVIAFFHYKTANN